jgi:catechol 2,3-dioxygenase-like lactoylglutathione lyase family enzyme
VAAGGTPCGRRLFAVLGFLCGLYLRWPRLSVSSSMPATVASAWCTSPTSRRPSASIRPSPHAGIRFGDDAPGRVPFTGEDYSFSLIDGRPLTEHVHLAFPSREDATVFVLDPDGHNVEVVNHNH